MSVTVTDYFQSKLKTIGINFSDADLAVFMTANAVNAADSVSSDTAKVYDKAFMEIVRAILITPDISEDDYSVKYDRKAIREWYAAECVRLGIPNLLNKGANQVKDISFLA